MIDLGNVEFLDSTALGVLVGALKRMRSKEGELVLVITKPGILKVFEITNLTQVFTIDVSRRSGVPTVARERSRIPSRTEPPTQLALCRTRLRA